MHIEHAEEPHLRIAHIAPAEVTVFLPTDGRPLFVESRLRVVASPESYGPWRSVAEWHQWVESFAVRRRDW